MIKLAPHQEKGFNNVIDSFDNQGLKNICIISPTGSGKTPIFGKVAKHYSEQKKYVCILTDRGDLLEQGEETLTKLFNVKTKKIDASVKKLDFYSIKNQEIFVFVAMVETLFNRLKNPLWAHFFEKFFLFIIDECHEARFRKLIHHETLRDSKFLGFTATPVYSQKSKKLSDDYEIAFILAQEQELIESGYLVKPKTISLPVDSSNVKTKSNGEFDEQDIIDLQNQYVTHEKIIKMYLDYSQEFIDYLKTHNPSHYYEKYHEKEPHVKAIFYCVNASHVLSIYNAFREASINCDFILSNTKIQTKKERSDVVRRFKNSEITVLINCQITTKGFDSKDTVLVGKLFLTTSLAKDNQVGGRCVRTTEPIHAIESKEQRLEMIEQSEKPYSIIIDYLGNYKIKNGGQQRGPWWWPKNWLDIFENGLRKKKGEAPTKECPKCSNSVPMNWRVCKMEVLNPVNFLLEPCGHIFPKGEGKEKKQVEELIEIDGILNKKELPSNLKNKAYSQMTFEELETYKSIKEKSFSWLLYQIKNTKGEKGLNEYANLKNYKHGFVEKTKERDKKAFQSSLLKKFESSPFKQNDILKVKRYFMTQFDEYNDFYFALKFTREKFDI